MKPTVTIYTDGACSGNPGPGGWAAILICGENRLELSGYDDATTNNRMELTASIMALKRLKTPCDAVIYSDSSYLVNAFQKQWLDDWQRRGWIKADKKPVLNQDLWLELLELCNIHSVTWKKVRGHSSNAENNRCDELARGAIKARRASQC